MPRPVPLAALILILACTTPAQAIVPGVGGKACSEYLRAIEGLTIKKDQAAVVARFAVFTSWAEGYMTANLLSVGGSEGVAALTPEARQKILNGTTSHCSAHPDAQFMVAVAQGVTVWATERMRELKDKPMFKEPKR